METWKHGNMDKWKNRDMETETWTWRKGYGDRDMETGTWRQGHGDRDMETGTWRQRNGDRDMDMDMRRFVF